MKNRLPAVLCLLFFIGSHQGAFAQWDNSSDPIYSLDIRVGLGTNAPQERLHLTRTPQVGVKEPIIGWSPTRYSSKFFNLGITTATTPASYLTNLPISGNNSTPDEGGDMVLSLGTKDSITGQDLVLTNRTRDGRIMLATNDEAQMIFTPKTAYGWPDAGAISIFPPSDYTPKQATFQIGDRTAIYHGSTFVLGHNTFWNGSGNERFKTDAGGDRLIFNASGVMTLGTFPSGTDDTG